MRVPVGRPRPVPREPACPALYPVPVRRVRVLASAPFRFRLTADTLASPRGSGHQGPQRTRISEVKNMPDNQQKKPRPGGTRLSL